MITGRRARVGVDDDLVGRVADEDPVASATGVGFDRQGIAAGIDVDGAVIEGPGRAAVHGDQEADAGRVRVHPRRWRR